DGLRLSGDRGGARVAPRGVRRRRAVRGSRTDGRYRGGDGAYPRRAGATRRACEAGSRARGTLQLPHRGGGNPRGSTRRRGAVRRGAGMSGPEPTPTPPVAGLTRGSLLARNAVLNLLGQSAPMLVALVAIPVLIAALGTERFGVLTLIWVVIGYFSLLDLGLGRALTHLVAEKLGAGREEEIPALSWTALALVLALGAAGGLVAALLAP